MSGKKGKSFGAGEEALKERTAVRVLYDDMGWFHGYIIRVLNHDGAKTSCLVAFEDGETAEAEFPSDDAQVGPCWSSGPPSMLAVHVVSSP